MASSLSDMCCRLVNEVSKLSWVGRWVLILRMILWSVLNSCCLILFHLFLRYVVFDEHCFRICLVEKNRCVLLNKKILQWQPFFFLEIGVILEKIRYAMRWLLLGSRAYNRKGGIKKIFGPNVDKHPKHTFPYIIFLSIPALHEPLWFCKAACCNVRCPPLKLSNEFDVEIYGDRLLDWAEKEWCKFKWKVESVFKLGSFACFLMLARISLKFLEQTMTGASVPVNFLKLKSKGMIIQSTFSDNSDMLDDAKSEWFMQDTVKKLRKIFTHKN